MLTILSRRDLLRIGTLGLTGGLLTQADVFRLQARSEAKPSHKAVIMIYLPGGPSHIDMYDMKPAAPANIRGEFKSIQTNVSGVEICELMPLQAKIADKFAIVRGLKFQPNNLHGPVELLTGFDLNGRGKPAFGAFVSRLRGAGKMPAHISLAGAQPGDPGYLGPAYRAFGSADESSKNLAIARGMTLERLAKRKSLLHSFDDLRREIDHRGELAGVDAFSAQALELITSNKTRDALDVSLEPAKIQARYGTFKTFLQARRLVEAGVSVVNIDHVPTRPDAFPKEANRFDWDTHDHNFYVLRRHLPVFDAGIYTLVTDLCERGLDREVAVVVWGEWGRSPRVGAQPKAAQDGGGLYNGRDHWPDAGFAVIAGGGLQMGQTIKDSGPRGERCTTRPYTPQNVLATLYHVLGIDPETTTLPNPAGPPRYLLEDTRRIDELV